MITTTYIKLAVWYCNIPFSTTYLIHHNWRSTGCGVVCVFFCWSTLSKLVSCMCLSVVMLWAACDVELCKCHIYCAFKMIWTVADSPNVCCALAGCTCSHQSKSSQLCNLYSKYGQTFNVNEDFCAGQPPPTCYMIQNMYCFRMLLQESIIMIIGGSL